MPKYTYRIYTSIEEIPQEWDFFGCDLFLQIPYLKAQEFATPKNMDYFYVMVLEQDQMVGKFIVQRLRVKGKEMFKSENRVKEELLNLLNLNLLCVGNVKLTGEHAWEVVPDIRMTEFLQTLHKVLNEIRRVSKKEDLPIQLLLIKDFYEHSKKELNAEFSGFTPLSVQPNMIFEKDKNWSTFDDYLAAMRTKYRTRAKRAFKKAEKVEFKELDLKEVIRLNSQMYALYLNVYNSASFSLYKLPENFFVQMKTEMPQSFKVFAGFVDNELICFYSLIENGNQIEAGFLGFDSNLQHPMQLYLNMLYRMIDFTILHDYNLIDFSRTALEIKSSVGAEPQQMFGFLKHTHPLMNQILYSTFRKFYQTEDWTPRNPFRD